MSRIFISYRRDDSAGYAGRLYDRLSAHFGEDQVFMDIDSIEPGVDFVQVVQDTVGKCDAVVALIGPNWLTVADVTGRRRLDNPADFVRIELSTALERDIRVYPVLVHGAVMPRPDDLPPDLARLSRRNAIELSDQRFNYDLRRLIEALQRALGRTPAASATAPLGGTAPDSAPAPADDSVPAGSQVLTADPAAEPERPASHPVASGAGGGIFRRRTWIWGGVAAAAAVVAIAAVLAVSLLGGHSTPKRALPTSTSVPVAAATRPPAPTATRTPRPTNTPRPAAINNPPPAPTSTPQPTSTLVPVVATKPPATSPPAPTNTPRPAPTRAPAVTAPTVVYATAWQHGLAGWTRTSPAWKIVSGILRYTGLSTDQAVAPVHAPKGPYAVQADIRHFACATGGAHGFGLYIRVPNTPLGSGGLFGGNWYTGTAPEANLWSDAHGFYSENGWPGAGERFHLYRLVVRGTRVQLFIDSILRASARVNEIKGAREVGLETLSCKIGVKGFRITRLP